MSSRKTPTGRVLHLVPRPPRPVPEIVVYGAWSRPHEGRLLQCERFGAGYDLTVELDEGPHCLWVSMSDLPRPPKPNAWVRILPYAQQPRGARRGQ